MNIECKYAYLAGVIDSDGYITIQRTKKNKKLPTGNICTNIYHCLKVGIAGTETQSHMLAKELFGGMIGSYKPKNDKHKTQYQWYLSNDLAVVFIKTILPYLLVKRAQAELALEFIAEYKKNIGGKKVTMEMRGIRDIYWTKMVALNSSRKRLQIRNTIILK
jgi:hypothetical protein